MKGGPLMEGYVTWTDLIQLTIALASVGAFIASIISIYKKR